jgi:hypothetical protein
MTISLPSNYQKIVNILHNEENTLKKTKIQKIKNKKGSGNFFLKKSIL